MEELEEIRKSLVHIESLLQRMPEMIASAVMLEEERKEKLRLQNIRYSDMVELCEVNLR